MEIEGRIIPPGWKLCPDCEGWGYTSVGPADNITDYPCYTCNQTGLVEDEDYEEPVSYSFSCGCQVIGENSTLCLEHIKEFNQILTMMPCQQKRDRIAEFFKQFETMERSHEG